MTTSARIYDGLSHRYVRAERTRSARDVLTPSPAKAATEITHFNLFRSIEVDGAPRRASAPETRLPRWRRHAKQTLPAGMCTRGRDSHSIKSKAATWPGIIFGLGIVFVFLVLAAQYDNLWDPLVILLSVPVAVLGALWAIGIRHIGSDVFVQVGLVMFIGLASKNAILIVEFANQLREKGLSARDASSARPKFDCARSS